MNDKALLARFVHEGDEAAFKALVERHQSALFAFLWRHVGNQEDAADLCQKVFVQVFLKAGQYRGEATFKSWLYQIAMNQYKNHLRTCARRPWEQSGTDDPARLANPGPEAGEFAHERSNLRCAIAALPEKQRQTLHLRLYEDYSFREIAEHMDCPVGTAKANYHHAVKNLRKTLLTGH